MILDNIRKSRFSSYIRNDSKCLESVKNHRFLMHQMSIELCDRACFCIGVSFVICLCTLVYNKFSFNTAAKCLCYLMKSPKAVLVLLKPFVSSRMFRDMSIDTVLTATSSRIHCNHWSLWSTVLTLIVEKKTVAPDCRCVLILYNYTTRNYIFFGWCFALAVIESRPRIVIRRCFFTLLRNKDMWTHVIFQY